MYNKLTHQNHEFTHSGRTILRVPQTFDQTNYILSAGLVLDLNPARKVYSDNGITLCTDNTLVYRWNDNSASATDFFKHITTDSPIWRSGATPYIDFSDTSSLVSQLTSTLNNPDMSIYIVSRTYSGNPSPYDTIMSKSSDVSWADGWAVATNNSYDLNTYLANNGAYSNGFGVKDIKCFRFKKSAAPRYNNNRINNRTMAAGSTVSITNPISYGAIVNGTWSTLHDEPTLKTEQYIWRILAYSDYHSDATQLQIINQLNSIYTVF